MLPRRLRPEGRCFKTDIISLILITVLQVPLYAKTSLYWLTIATWYCSQSAFWDFTLVSLNPSLFRNSHPQISARTTNQGFLPTHYGSKAVKHLLVYHWYAFSKAALYLASNIHSDSKILWYYREKII